MRNNHFWIQVWVRWRRPWSHIRRSVSWHEKSARCRNSQHADLSSYPYSNRWHMLFRILGISRLLSIRSGRSSVSWCRHHQWSGRWRELLLTDTLFLVSVPVPLLTEGLITQGAKVGARVRMRANVILHVAQLVKLFEANFALHLLILPTGLGVDYLHSSPQLFLFPDHLVFESWNFIGGIRVFNFHIFWLWKGPLCFKNLRAKKLSTFLLFKWQILVFLPMRKSALGAEKAYPSKFCRRRHALIRKLKICDVWRADWSRLSWRRMMMLIEQRGRCHSRAWCHQRKALFKMRTAHQWFWTYSLR